MNEADVIKQFTAFLESKVPPHDNLIIEDGAYSLHADGVPNGWCMSWKNGKEEKEIWKYSYSDDERREYAKSQSNPALKAQSDAEKQAREQRRAEALRQQKEDEAQARLMALAEYKAASPITPLEHAYASSRRAITGTTPRF